MIRLLPKRRWQRYLAVLLVAVALWSVASVAAAYKLTRRRRPVAPEKTPTVTWATVTEHRLHTPDGEEIGGWLFDVPEARGCALLLHGNGGARHRSLSRAELLAGAGFSSFAISLRCHGDSTGDVNDFGRSAAADVVAAVEFLERARRGTDIVVVGNSLGAAAAIFAAGALGERVSAYVLECPYRDLRTAVWNRARFYLPPVLDALAYRGLLLASSAVLDDVDGISPIRAIVSIPESVPVLLLAGGRDRRAPAADVRELEQRISTHARTVVFPSAEHGKLYATAPGLYATSVLEFLAQP